MNQLERKDEIIQAYWLSCIIVFRKSVDTTKTQFGESLDQVSTGAWQIPWYFCLHGFKKKIGDSLTFDQTLRNLILYKFISSFFFYEEEVWWVGYLHSLTKSLHIAFHRCFKRINLIYSVFRNSNCPMDTFFICYRLGCPKQLSQILLAARGQKLLRR